MWFGKLGVCITSSVSSSVAKKRKEAMIHLAERIHHKLEQSKPNLEYQIGLGRYYASNIQLFRSFYEAKVALELGKYESHFRAVRHFEDIGIVRLLSNIHKDLLHEFYEETLGELISLDKDNDDFYIETLEAFFHHNGDVNQTAKQLYVHANTLRKRLKKIESILNIDLTQYDDILNISVALKIMKMVK
jgi:DNA-binding PucR family transcriptional regulator